MFYKLAAKLAARLVAMTMGNRLILGKDLK